MAEPLAASKKLHDVKKPLFIIALLIQIHVLHSQVEQSVTVPQSFKHLKCVELKNSFTTEQGVRPRVYFENTFGTEINKEVSEGHQLYDEISVAVGSHEFVRTKISKTESEYYRVIFDFGMSMDPGFSFYKEQNDSLKYVFSVNGLCLYIPSNGNIYTEGHANTFFNLRRKYKIIGDSIVEVKQPFKYVGITTKTKGLLKLYKDKDLQEIVAVLPKNSEIEVLANDGKYFLIKTSFGLLGWWKIDSYYSQIIEELYLNGD